MAVLWGVAANAQTALVIDDNTPIMVSNKQIMVLVDPDKTQTLESVIPKTADFQTADQVGKFSPYVDYWVTQKLVSRLNEDRLLRIDASNTGVNWVVADHFIVRPNGQREAVKPQGSRGLHNQLANINPFTQKTDLGLSQYGVFVLHKGEEVQIFSKLHMQAAFPPKSFAISIYDHASYLELRRFGLYLEGGIAGILLALCIFSWYSAYQNRDATSFYYGVWLLFGLAQAITLPIHDGQRFFEMFVHLESIETLGPGYLSSWISSMSSYGQTMMYVVFARSFLDLKTHFPRFYQLTNIWLVWELISLSALLLWDHDLSQSQFWNPTFFPILGVLLSIYFLAFLRYRQGLHIAKFFMIAMVPYLCFRSVFLIGILGLPSPFSFLPSSGFGLFFQNTFTNQSFGVCCEAMIMALAVISRTRWLQQELANSIQAQSDLMANQNKVLEHTVAERTKELAEQHQALDDAHQLVVGSVNYASRLQRGQLPRPVRLENRFASFATIWEPRDTIGGDLYWVSSSQHDGPFVLAVADCTGHGVPGAMLSLLVSNSLERIYANDTMEDPVSALTSLDHYVRTGLNQDRPDSESDDGCDATVLRIDRRLQRLEFGGAKIDLFHVTADGVVTRHMAQRVSLGYKDRVSPSEVPPVKVLSYQKGDMFAIVTDGLTDQVGGEAGKPKVSYGYRRLEQLLSAHAGGHAQQVVDALRQDFASWQGTHSRRDDVTAVVFTL
ncbi:MAG: SpoIIE family protein phosphatase [Limnohabitans sp.]